MKNFWAANEKENKKSSEKGQNAQVGRLCQASRIQEKSCGKKPHIFYILIQARLEIILDRACTLGDVL